MIIFESGRAAGLGGCFASKQKEEFLV